MLIFAGYRRTNSFKDFFCDFLNSSESFNDLKTLDLIEFGSDRFCFFSGMNVDLEGFFDARFPEFKAEFVWV
jgi:hypothetical protein